MAVQSQHDPSVPPGTDVALRVDGLTVSFPGPEGRVAVVDDVCFSVRTGEALGIVGESGSGKTMTARSVIGLLPRQALRSGSIEFAGRDVSSASEGEWSRLRGSEIGLVAQDAMSGLNPVRTIGSTLIETVRRHRKLSRSDAKGVVIEVLGSVGIPQPSERFGVYPHQLSGGLRQRVMIAMAIVNEPAVIIADEPTTALDATIQAQILERLRTLKTNAGLVMITHDLGVAAALCDRILVMYAGRVVELGAARDVLKRPRHPYTAGLIDAVPRFDRGRTPLVAIRGVPPHPTEIGDWCAFAPRCSNVQADCRESRPKLTDVDGRLAACYHPVGVHG